MILIDFVVRVKLFLHITIGYAQVVRNLAIGRNLQSASVKQSHAAMMMSMGFVAFVTNDAVDCIAAHPELAFLWCLVFHD